MIPSLLVVDERPPTHEPPASPLASAGLELPVAGDAGDPLDTVRRPAAPELGLELETQVDPCRLLATVARAAGAILRSRYAVVAVGAAPGTPRYAASHGMTPVEEERVTGAVDLRAGELGALLADGRPRRLEGLRGDGSTLGLAPGHPAVDRLLAVRIATATAAHGWLYVANPFSGGAYGDDDEQLALGLAGLLAPACERPILLAELQRHADRIARLTRARAVLSGINSAIVRIHDRRELLQEACRIAIAEGQFDLAWVATVDVDSPVDVLACAGDDAEGLEALAPRLRPVDLASRALRELRPVVCNDVSREPALAEGANELLARGYRSLAVLPLVVDRRAVALLNLLAREPELFDADEIEVLLDLADDISFGLQSIHGREQLDQLAHYDALTGLANQTLFRDRLRLYLQGAAEVDGSVAVIEIDLDSFAALNDTLGRHVGDILLRGVAERLERQFLDKGLVARVGADSFGVVVGGLKKETDASAVLEHRIFDAILADPLPVGEHELRLTAHAGIALYPMDGRDADTLLEKADAALKRARSQGDRFLFYEPAMTARAAQRLLLEQRMRDAVAHHQFELHYQTRVSARTGELLGLEALLRWNDPESGLVMPGSFIPALEESGMIVEVGSWVQLEALSQMRRWRHAGFDPPRVAVNVSAVELRQPDFFSKVESAIDAAGAEAEDLELEITESLIMDRLEVNRSTLHQIRDLGVTIAIDDFGTGYSSLAYLAQLPADSLKIDHSFVLGMADDSNSLAIVSAVISLAHSLRLKVVAEGVESIAQAELLRSMGCDELQGYLISRPQPAAAIEPLLPRGGRPAAGAAAGDPSSASSSRRRRQRAGSPAATRERSEPQRFPFQLEAS